MLQNLERKIPYLLVIAFFYSLAYILIDDLPVEDLLKKSLYVNNILFYSPLVTLVLSMVYAIVYGFSWQFSVWTTVLFFLTIPVFGEWILLYQVVYLLCSFIGNGLGEICYRWRKRFRKN